MNPPPTPRLLLSALLLRLALSASPLLDFFRSHCADSLPFESTLTDSQRIFNRGQEIGSAVSIASIAEFVKKGGSSPLLGQVASFSAPLFIFILLVLFSLALFSIFLFYCDRFKTTRQKWANSCFILASVFLFVFVGFFVATFVMILRANGRLTDPVCEVARVFVNFARGARYASSSFSGFDNLSRIMASFDESLQRFPDLQMYFQNIFDANLESQALPAYQSLLVFSDSYRDQRTNDGQGRMTRPTSVRNLTSAVNDELYLEFSRLQQAANKITSAMEVALKVLNLRANYDFVSRGVKDFGRQLMDLAKTLGDKVEPNLLTGIVILTNSARLLWLTFTLGLVSVLMGGIALVFIWYQQENKLDRCRLAVKVLLVSLTVATFALSVLLLFFSLISVTVTSGCQAVPGILASRNLIDLLFDWGLGADSVLSRTAQTCLAATATGSLTYLLEDNFNSFEQIWFYLDGLSLMAPIQRRLAANGTATPAISKLVQTWESYQSILTLDQPQAATALLTFNQRMNCTGTEFVFNRANCTGLYPCTSVLEREGFLPPQCATDPDALTFMFNNLKAFTNDEIGLMNRMVTDMAGPSTQTPLALVTATKEAFLSIGTSFERIRNSTGEFMQWLPPQGGFTANMNCTVLRQSVLNLEDLLCFRTNNVLVYFVIFLGLMVFGLFGFAWTLCLTMTCMDRLIEDLKIHQDSARNLSGVRMLDNETSQLHNEKGILYD